MSVVLITGAAGQIGAMLRPRLAGAGRMLRLLDTAPLTAGVGEEAIQASVTDMAAMTLACAGADAVIHLGGLAAEAPWHRIAEVNIGGTYVVFEAARRPVSAGCCTHRRTMPSVSPPLPITRCRTTHSPHRTPTTACPW